MNQDPFTFVTKTETDVVKKAFQETAIRHPETAGIVVALNHPTHTAAEPKKRAVFRGFIKRAKSTIINALLAMLIAPAKTLETTGTINWIQDGTPRAHDKQTFRIIWKNGKVEERAIEQLQHFSGDSDEVMRNTDKVAKIEIEVTALLLKKWVFIDTPGIKASTTEAHTRLAEGFVRDGDFEVLVHVMESANELPHLQNLSPFLSHIFVYSCWDKHIDVRHPNPFQSVVDECNQIKNSLALQGLIAPEVIPCCPIAGLAAQRVTDADFWDDVAKLATASRCALGGLIQQSMFYGHNTFSGASVDVHRRKQMMDWLDGALRGPFDLPTYSPGFPAMRLAIVLAAHRGIQTGEELRTELLHISGIPALRQTLARLADSPFEACQTAVKHTIEPYQHAVNRIELDIHQDTKLIQANKQAHTPPEMRLAIERLKRYRDAATRVRDKLKGGIAATIAPLQQKLFNEQLDRECLRYLKQPGTVAEIFRGLAREDTPADAWLSEADRQTLLCLFGNNGPEVFQRLGTTAENAKDEQLARLAKAAYRDVQEMRLNAVGSMLHLVLKHAIARVTHILAYLSC